MPAVNVSQTFGLQTGRSEPTSYAGQKEHSARCGIAGLTGLDADHDFSATMVVMSGSVNELLTPGEVAAMFRVDPKTVRRWARDGKLSSLRTLGGHRRYVASEVRALSVAQVEPARVDDASGSGVAEAPLGATAR